MRKLSLVASLVATLCISAFAQQIDIKAIVVKHLKISRDFTLKVAEQMPDADYGFNSPPRR